MPSDIALSAIERFLDPVGSGANHLGVDAELLAVINLESVFGRISIEDGGNVVLGVTGGEEHAGDGQHLVNAFRS